MAIITIKIKFLTIFYHAIIHKYFSLNQLKFIVFLFIFIMMINMMANQNVRDLYNCYFRSYFNITSNVHHINICHVLELIASL